MLRRLFVMFLLGVFLGGCGIKPESVDPPVGVEHDSFPNTYPDITTDPEL